MRLTVGINHVVVQGWLQSVMSAPRVLVVGGSLLVFMHQEMMVLVAHGFFFDAKMRCAFPLANLLNLRIIMVATFMRLFTWNNRIDLYLPEFCRW